MIRPMGSVIKSLSKERYKTAKSLCRNGFGVSKTHSHSIVAMGLGLRSYSTRSTPLTSARILSVILRAVNTVDAMTATVEQVPWPVLLQITDRILAEVKGVNRVLYDLSPKPVATIEWE